MVHVHKGNIQYDVHENISGNVILVSGGQDTHAGLLNSVEVLDVLGFHGNSSCEIELLPEAVYGHTMASLDHAPLTCGGNDGGYQ